MDVEISVWGFREVCFFVFFLFFGCGILHCCDPIFFLCKKKTIFLDNISFLGKNNITKKKEDIWFSFIRGLGFRVHPIKGFVISTSFYNMLSLLLNSSWDAGINCPFYWGNSHRSTKRLQTLLLTDYQVSSFWVTRTLKLSLIASFLHHVNIPSQASSSCYTNRQCSVRERSHPQHMSLRDDGIPPNCIVGVACDTHY